MDGLLLLPLGISIPLDGRKWMDGYDGGGAGVGGTRRDSTTSDKGDARSARRRVGEKVAEKTTTGVTRGSCIGPDGRGWGLVEA